MSCNMVVDIRAKYSDAPFMPMQADRGEVARSNLKPQLRHWFQGSAFCSCSVAEHLCFSGRLKCKSSSWVAQQVGGVGRMRIGLKGRFLSAQHSTILQLHSYPPFAVLGVP